MLTLEPMVVQKAQLKLVEWYRENQRALPWRANRDPYRIWLAETMLQQTTTTAVIPYYERFLKRFPTIKDLAQAKTPEVVEAWAGLGYYSRARNLHKSAQRLFAAGSFPRTYEQLLEYPGFGPYTARSVASLAFDAPVGVVDGNVIRVLARYEGHDWDWWLGKTRATIQTRADAWVQGVSSYEMNQALMELGRTVCMPKTAFCLLCPLRSNCVGFRAGNPTARPRPKPRHERELWLWEPEISIRNQRILLRKNVQVPFLRNQWLVPGEARRLTHKPKSFDYRHSITHHDIYVTVKSLVLKMRDDDKWIPLKDIHKFVPASLLHKALAHLADSAAHDAPSVRAGSLKTRPPARK